MQLFSVSAFFIVAEAWYETTDVSPWSFVPYGDRLACGSLRLACVFLIDKCE
ncbi:MAG: hypothetical protein ACE5NG_19825 [bacterium]